jgi:hypothetical protein
MFGPKRDEVIGGWKHWHNGKLYNLYASSNFRTANSRRMRLVRHAARIGEMCIQSCGRKIQRKEITRKV